MYILQTVVISHSVLCITGDGEIDFAEFLRLMWKHHCKGIDYHTNLKEAFKVFDRDNSGTIDKVREERYSRVA